MAIPFGERERSIPAIVLDLVNQFATLLQQESRLARAEISEAVSRMIAGMVMAVIAAVLLVPALVILLLAAVYALETTGLAPSWSALAVGGGALIVGLILMLLGVNRLKAKNLIPRRTIHQFEEDAALAKSQVNGAEERTGHGFERAA